MGHGETGVREWSDGMERHGERLRRDRDIYIRSGNGETDGRMKGVAIEMGIGVGG